MEDRDIYWLAGILEGEGSFCKGPPSAPNMPQIAVQMCDEDVIARVAGLFGVSYCKATPKESHHKPSFRTQLRGSRAVELMQPLRPLMGRRRQTQIDDATATYVRKPRPLRLTEEDYEEIKRLKDSGWSLRKIARLYGCNHESVRNVLNRYVPREPNG